LILWCFIIILRFWGCAGQERCYSSCCKFAETTGSIQADCVRLLGEKYGYYGYFDILVNNCWMNILVLWCLTLSLIVCWWINRLDQMDWNLNLILKIGWLCIFCGNESVMSCSYYYVHTTSSVSYCACCEILLFLKLILVCCWLTIVIFSAMITQRWLCTMVQC
jgi:hypothetical protein